MPDRPDPEAFLPLHPLELRILLAVTRRRAAHGYRIVKEIEALEGDRFNLHPANLYRRIRNLLADGLLTEADPPAGEEDADPRRTYFDVTELGTAVVRAETARLEELLADARRCLERT